MVSGMNLFAGHAVVSEREDRLPRIRVIDLASNDYLGLARDPRITGAAAAAAVRWGAGSTGSRLVTGSTDLHATLEADLAAFLGAAAGLVFSSGYLANIGVVTALSGPGATVVSDALNHASVVDACRLSRAQGGRKWRSRWSPRVPISSRRLACRCSAGARYAPATPPMPRARWS